MFQIGQFNQLKIARRAEPGFYLRALDAPDTAEGEPRPEEVLMPNKFITPEMKEGDEVRVFVYKDSEDRMVAVTTTPKVLVNQCAYLEVLQVTGIGAFLDWGLEKQILLPFSEQGEPVEVGNFPLVYVYLDAATKRIVASTNLNKFIKNNNVELKLNDEVELLISYETPLGVRTIINDKHWGVLYRNEIFAPLQKGSRVKGFVKKIREDGKIDVALQKQGIVAALDASQVIVNKLKEVGGKLMLSDNSSPEEIHAALRMSKKIFKRSVGILYKKGLVELHDDCVVLLQDE